MKMNFKIWKKMKNSLKANEMSEILQSRQN